VKSGPVPVVAAYDWTGCYVGGHVGGLWGRTKQSSPFANTDNLILNRTVDLGAAAAGGHLGCNVQYRQIVFGVEADASWTRVEETGLVDIARGELIRTKFDWYSSVRGRLGISFDRNLIYGTGGVAFGAIHYRYEETCCLASIKSSNGWVVGGGWEYALTDNWITRAEYFYYDFGKIDWYVGVDVQTSFHVGRIGLSYKFGPSAVATRVP
jgi:outer membrane immunogenic protein